MVKSLNFNDNPYRQRARMSRRAWFLVYGSEKIQPNQNITSLELEERMSKLYHNLELNEVYEPLTNYVALRNQNCL